MFELKFGDLFKFAPQFSDFYDYFCFVSKIFFVAIEFFDFFGVFMSKYEGCIDINVVFMFENVGCIVLEGGKIREGWKTQIPVFVRNCYLLMKYLG